MILNRRLHLKLLCIFDQNKFKVPEKLKIGKLYKVPEKFISYALTDFKPRWTEISALQRSPTWDTNPGYRDA